MSDGMNRVTLLGNLGADAELKALPSGESVCNLRMATTASWFDKEAQARQERTEWHSITIFGKRGEGIAKYLKKGDRILVEGELRTRKYEKEGVTHFATSIVAKEVFFAGSAKPVGAKGAKASAGDGGGDFPHGLGGEEEEEIPFDVPQAKAKAKNGKTAQG